MATYREITRSFLVRMFVVSTAILFTPAMLNATDLNTWTAEGGGASWNVIDGGQSVLQTINGDPTIFFDSSAASSQNIVLSGKIKVTTSDDNDAVGFVIGYKAGDIAPSATEVTDFFLIDWRQVDQDNGLAGLAISHVSKVSKWWPNFWSHADGVTEIQRGQVNLARAGWQDAVEYTFSIHFTTSLITVEVGGVEELRITPADVAAIGVNGSFSDGAFGFYNMSQSHVLYSAVTTTDCNANPNAEGCGTLANNCQLSLDVAVEGGTGGGGFIPYCDTTDANAPITGRPTSLTFEYTGGGCGSAGGNEQGSDASCAEENGGVDALAVAVTAVSGKKSHHHHGHHSHHEDNEYLIDPPGEIVPEGSFTITVDSTCEERFESKTKITLTNSEGSEINDIHTSCSVPLNVGDVFGSLTLVAINGMVEEGGSSEYTYTYTVTNTSTESANSNAVALSNVTVTDGVFGIIEPILSSLAGGGSQATFIYTTDVSIDQANIVASVTADLNGVQDCSDSTSGADSDLDGVLDINDNCVFIHNPAQNDADNDGTGDLCESGEPTVYDTDNDGISDLEDNCPLTANPDQQDVNGNGIGDVCDATTPATGCNSGNGNYDLLLLMLLVLGLSYGHGVWRSQRT